LPAELQQQVHVCEGPGLADTGGRLFYAAWAGA
jgi:hypothetical protein